MSTLLDLLQHPDWDAAFFKRLANNDTGNAPGHQGGIVIPQDLRQYFPVLDEGFATFDNPTTDRHIFADLFLNLDFRERVTTRYQFQTWGGTRSPESRLTDNLGPIRNQAHGGDIMIFQRRKDGVSQFRLLLITQNSEFYPLVEGLVDGRRWGALNAAHSPVSSQEFRLAMEQITEVAEVPFTVTREEIIRVVTRQNRVVRDHVFPFQVKREYANSCAISGVCIMTPELRYEVEAAHIVPVEEGGVDDVRNGLALTRSIHWAFDRGLIGITPTDKRVYVPRQVRDLPANSFLTQWHGRQIAEASREQFRVHPDALEWHLAHRVRHWE